jgi:hypothetical protein
MFGIGPLGADLDHVIIQAPLLNGPVVLETAGGAGWGPGTS